MDGWVHGKLVDERIGSTPTKKRPQLPRNIRHRDRMPPRPEVRCKVLDGVVLLARVREDAAATGDDVECLRRAVV